MCVCACFGVCVFVCFGVCVCVCFCVFVFVCFGVCVCVCLCIFLVLVVSISATQQALENVLSVNQAIFLFCLLFELFEVRQ